MNNQESKQYDDMEDRFTPEGIPVTAPVYVGMKGFSFPDYSTLFEENNPRKVINYKNQVSAISTSENEGLILNSSLVVIILILSMGLSWL
ncbi:MAG: hypothetical protein ABIL39_08755 [candidate division WOR-3 bacterium]